MVLNRVFVLYLALSVTLVTSQAVNAVRPTHLQSLIDEEQKKCESGLDSMSCIKERAMRFLDTVMNNDNFKISDVEVSENGYKASDESQARNNPEDSFVTAIENYIQGHDVTMDMPTGDAKITLSSRNLANNELSLNLKFVDNEDVFEGKGKKHRLRKMIMPLMVLILLKAITVIPMAIGILKIKALNALGLGFLSFIVSVGLAIFQLCKKIASEHHSAHIHAHGAWDGRKLDSFMNTYEPNEAAQNLVYSAHA